MRHSSILLSAAVVLLVLSCGVAHGDLKIMPLGDSNTGIDPDLFPEPPYNHSSAAFQNLNKYRESLFDLLTARGLDVDLVGTQDSGESGLDDRDNEGHGGYRIRQIAYGPGGDPANPSGGIHDWLVELGAGQAPDMIILMIGTNDILQGYHASASTNLAALLDLLIAELPEARIFVASIPPIDVAEEPEWSDYADALNAAIPGLVADRAAAGNDIRFVDVNAGLTTDDLSSDGVHLTEAGLDKVGAAFAAVVPEPATVLFLGLGLLPMLRLRRRPKAD